MVQPEVVYETVLYAEDLGAMAEFYSNTIGLELLSQNDLMLVFSIGPGYLLIFNPTKSVAPGRMVPSHGTSGEGHIAFAASEDSLSEWRDKLSNHGVEIESEVQWDDGQRGTSIYFRDPAGNSVELAPPILWSYLRSQNTG